MPNLRAGSRIAAVVFTCLLAACSEQGAHPNEGRGTVIIATAADADFLLPPVLQTVQGKQVVDQVFDYLADPPASLSTVGDGGYAPRLARSWSWSADSLSIAFELNPAARWHDGTPVRASDVRFTLDLIKDPQTASSLAPSLSDVDSISVRDSVTAVVWFARRSPEQFFQVIFNLAVLPEHLLASVPRDKLRESDFAQHPVGSGRFRFSRWEKGSVIELVADTANFRGRPSIDRVIWSTTPDPTTLWARVVNEEADFVEIVRGDAVAKVAASSVATLMPYPSLDYGYVQFNLRDKGSARRPHALLSDVALRRALSLGVDVRSTVRNVLDTLGYPGIGPVVRAQSTADTTLTANSFDQVKAGELLDSLGWRDTNGDGVRERGGKPLRFALSTPISSATRRQMAVLLQAQWKQLGVDVTIEELEPNTFFERLRAGNFDAALNAWHTDPTPSSARQSWGSAALPEKGGSNFGGYSSAAFDAYLDSAATSFDPARSKQLYRQAYKQIISDAAAIWLYEPRLTAAVNRRLNITGVRADAWWAGIPDWSIAPDKRIARDRLPLSAGTVPAAPAADSAK
ncbi:MAG: peptide ABC transporter substrate-binding protein [Gemmatimonadaceae bacterium]